MTKIQIFTELIAWNRESGMFPIKHARVTIENWDRVVYTRLTKMILISVMLFCYFLVLVALKRPRPGEVQKERDNNMKRRASLIILAIIVSFVVTYLLLCAAILSNLSSWHSTNRRIFTKTCTFIQMKNGTSAQLHNTVTSNGNL